MLLSKRGINIQCTLSYGNDDWKLEFNITANMLDETLAPINSNIVVIVLQSLCPKEKGGSFLGGRNDREDPELKCADPKRE